LGFEAASSYGATPCIHMHMGIAIDRLTQAAIVTDLNSFTVL